MRKAYKLLSCVLIGLTFVILLFLQPSYVVNADAFFDDTLIYTYYNEHALNYADLSDVSQIAINDAYIAYSTNSTTINIINKTTKQNIRFNPDSNFSNIVDIYLARKYLFVQDNTTLRAFDINDLTEIDIKVDNDDTIGTYNKFSIAESNDRIAIACIGDHEFVTYFFKINNLVHTNTYTNTALTNETNTMLNVVTTVDGAYIINDATNSSSSSLWKIDYSKNNQFDKSLFPKPDITSLITYKCQDNNTQYLLAIDNKNIIYVLRTDLSYAENVEDFNADQTRNGNTADSRFVVNDLYVPEDIYLFDNNIYISDSGTKCIQQFSFVITSDQKGSIAGRSIVLAGESGEVGRFNRNSNIELSEDKLIVADTNNQRIQILEDNTVTCIDQRLLTNTTAYLGNLNNAVSINNVVYFTTYNDETSTQNIYSYNISNNTFKTISHSINKVIDMTSYKNNIYILSTNGIFALTTTDDTIVAISNATFNDTARINICEEKIIVADGHDINVLSINGDSLYNTTITYTITDIACKQDKLYVLDDNDNKIIRYQVFDDSIDEIDTLSYLDLDAIYYSITVDAKSGILYLFDNKCSKIDKIINPNFNYSQNIGVFQVNNRNVSVYDRPYYLNGIDTPNVIKTLQLNSRVNIYSTTPIHYGNIEYYIIAIEDNTFGYINSKDLTYLHEVINYEVILPNATLRGYGNQEYIDVFDEPKDDANIIAKADVNQRVFVSNLDTTSDYTYVRYYNANQEIVEGYVKTTHINSDDLTKPQYLAIILIVISIVLLVAIIITAIVIHKKRLKQGNK